MLFDIIMISLASVGIIIILYSVCDFFIDFIPNRPNPIISNRQLINTFIGKGSYYEDFPRQLRNEIELIQSTNKEYYAKQNLHIV